MAKLCPLFSGSSGNSYYLGSSQSGILIDAGRSSKQLVHALESNEINPKNIKAVFITHEHIDHCKGLKVFCAKYHIPAYTSSGTIQALKEKDLINDATVIHPIDTGGIELDNIKILPFPLSHDCAEGFGYTAETSDGRKTAFLTDTGCITSSIFSAVSGCDTVVIESNHDIRMLEAGNYPYSLKRRILSNYGHLSNDTCSETIVQLIKTGSTRFLLAHISRENNLPYLAEQTSLCRLAENQMKANRDFILSVLPPENQTGSILY